MSRLGAGDRSDPFGGLPELDPRIGAWVDGCLGEPERSRFEAELRVNPKLRQQLADYEATVADVQEALGAPIVEVALADRVLEALDAPPATSAGARRRAAPLWALVAAAAALALVVWADQWAGQSNRVAADAAPARARSEQVSLAPRQQAPGEGPRMLQAPSPDRSSGLGPAAAAKIARAPDAAAPRDRGASRGQVRLRVPASARAQLARWLGAGPRAPASGRPQPSVQQRARAWLAREALDALGRAEAAPAGPASASIGAVRLERLQGSDPAWQLAGPRQQVSALLRALAGYADELGGQVEPRAVETAVGRGAREPAVAGADVRVVLRFETQR